MKYSRSSVMKPIAGSESEKAPPNRSGSEALLCLWGNYPKIVFRSSSGVLIGAML